MGMTEQRALEVISEEFETLTPHTSKLFDDAMEVSIKALEEVQQYRALGTVEELKALKEKNEPKGKRACWGADFHRYG